MVRVAFANTGFGITLGSSARAATVEVSTGVGGIGTGRGGDTVSTGGTTGAVTVNVLLETAVRPRESLTVSVAVLGPSCGYVKVNAVTDPGAQFGSAPQSHAYVGLTPVEPEAEKEHTRNRHEVPSAAVGGGGVGVGGIGIGVGGVTKGDLSVVIWLFSVVSRHPLSHGRRRTRESATAESRFAAVCA